MDRLMRGNSRRWARAERGDALTEFALLAPILVLLLFGIFELGRVVDAGVVVHNAAREGARTGAASASATAASSATQATQDYLDTALASRGDVTAGSVEAVEIAGQEVIAVRAVVHVQVYTPVMQRLLAASLVGGTHVPVGATAHMRRL